MDPHTRAATKNTSHGNVLLPQDTTHLTQRPCYQWGSLCQVLAGNRTTRKPEVVWTCLPFIRSGQYHLARHNEREKKTRQTEKERKLVVKSYAMPQRHLQSWNRWKNIIIIIIIIIYGKDYKTIFLRKRKRTQNSFSPQKRTQNAFYPCKRISVVGACLKSMTKASLTGKKEE